MKLKKRATRTKAPARRESSTAMTVARQLTRVRQELAGLRRSLDQLKKLWGEQAGRVVVLQELAPEEAKHLIAQAVERRPGIGYEELVEELRIDLETVVELCRELVHEGRIKPQDGNDTLRPR